VSDVALRLVDVFQHACRLHAELSMTPRWRWRRRARLARELEDVAAVADSLRAAIGVVPGALGLRAILADADRPRPAPPRSSRGATR